MFVSESNIFDPGNIKIRVSSMDGKEIELDVNPEITIDHLKIQISSHLYDPVESVKTSLYHRILHVSSGNVMDENHTLSAYHVKDGDELLLIRKRVPGPTLEGMESKIREDSRKTPTTEDVKQATQSIPSQNTDRPKPDVLQLMNFKDELRKILISLIDAAQKILCLNPEAAKIFEEAEKCMTDQQAAPSPQITVDPAAVTQLVNMGFPETRARHALRQTHMSAEHAIQWLLEHEGEDIEDDTETSTMDDAPPPSSTDTGAEGQETAGATGATTSQVCTDIEDDTETSTMDDTPPPSSTDTGAEGQETAGATGATTSQMTQAMRLAQMSGTEKVKKMLDGFRAYRRREFKPNPKALKILVEMGFSEADATDALCIHGNKQEEACDWLLSGGHKSQRSSASLEGGLDPDSPVYRSIMANPVVQLGLSNPKSLLAFLMVLENPNSTQQWINDPDTGPMLIQISRIYHAERHAPTTST